MLIDRDLKAKLFPTLKLNDESRDKELMDDKITPATHPNRFALFDHGDYGTMYMKKSSLVKKFQLDRRNGIITLYDKGDNEEE